ncbi:MAG: hypothetical protein R6U86_00090 [Bacteroidales bacterium]
MASAPVFRKSILPWYDTNTACILALILMAAVMLFGVEGVRMSGKTEAYREHVWVPVLLIVLSGMVTASILIRLIRRYHNRFSY